MVQQGQVFKLRTKGSDGRPLWANRYRLQGRGSKRIQAGGFASHAEAQRALRKALDRLRPGAGTLPLTRVRGGVSAGASRNAVDDLEASLAAQEGDRRIRGDAPCRPDDRADLQVADDHPRRAPL
jgi:hypothetical protein